MICKKSKNKTQIIIAVQNMANALLHNIEAIKLSKTKHALQLVLYFIMKTQYSLNAAAGKK